jgi:cation transport ATPase
MLNKPDREMQRPSVVCRSADQACDVLDLQLARSWLRIAVAAVFAGQGMVFSLALNMTPPLWGSSAYLVLHGGLIFSALIVLLFLGGPLFRSTYGMLRARRLSIEGLFTLSLLGAFVGSILSSVTGVGAVYYEVVAVVVGIYTAGRMLGERSQAKLMLASEQLRQSYDRAQVVNAAGQVERMAVGAVAVGALVRVDLAEPFTVDGVLTAGIGYVRETALTGEPFPVVRRPGDFVRAGTWSVDAAFELRATAVGGTRELDQILERVESVGGQPSQLQMQANALMQFFLPLVAAVSLCTALYWTWAATWVTGVFNSMAVLLVACPCALGLATPVAIWQGLYHLARMGLQSRDGALIDALAQTQQVYFDKTGTLSESSMRLSEQLWVDRLPLAREVLLSAVIAVESRMRHPVAQALINGLSVANLAQVEIVAWQALAGQGVAGQLKIGVHCYQLQVGEAELCADEHSAELTQLSAGLVESEGKRCYVVLEGRPVAVFVLREHARAGLEQVWHQLQLMQVKATVLTGDPEPQFALPATVAIQSGLSASGKADVLRRAAGAGEFPIFVGDGVNDAAAMAEASASIAMASGAGLTRSIASAQLTANQIELVPDAIALARKIYTRIRTNLAYALCYNLIGMGLAAAGLLHPVAAALIMLISSLLVTLRALNYKSAIT